MLNAEMEKLPIMEHFYTVQGEGVFTGHAAYFIRLGGCDVGCVWCDVKDSWDKNAHPLMEIEDLVNAVIQTPAKICVITGGEPAMYDLNNLTNALKSKGINTHIETSGAYPILGNFDWICLSPKKFKFPIEESLNICDEYKQVVYHPSDIEWSNQFLKHLKPDCKWMLQPEWSKSDNISAYIVDYVKSNPKWSISLQTHKYLSIP